MTFRVGSKVGFVPPARRFQQVFHFLQTVVATIGLENPHATAVSKRYTPSIACSCFVCSPAQDVDRAADGVVLLSLAAYIGRAVLAGD